MISMNLAPNNLWNHVAMYPTTMVILKWFNYHKSIGKSLPKFLWVDSQIAYSHSTCSPIIVASIPQVVYLQENLDRDLHACFLFFTCARYTLALHTLTSNSSKRIILLERE